MAAFYFELVIQLKSFFDAEHRDIQKYEKSENNIGGFFRSSSKQIKDFPLKTSTIARGIAVGDELEYADEVTLGRSILHRIPFENSLKNNQRKLRLHF